MSGWSSWATRRSASASLVSSSFSAIVRPGVVAAALPSRRRTGNSNDRRSSEVSRPTSRRRRENRRKAPATLLSRIVRNHTLRLVSDFPRT